MADQNVKTLYDSGEKQRQQVDSACSSTTAADQQRILDAISTYEECLKLVDRSSLFSPNETVEDLTANDLQYLLINYRIAELIIRVNHKDRKSVIQRAREEYEKYLHLIYQYEILSDPEKKLYEKYNESPSKFSTIPTNNPNARRETKMSNFRLEKELKKKLDFLSKNSANFENDEESLREFHLTNISLCTYNTFQALESLNRELEVLMMAPPSPPECIESLEQDYRERMGLREKKDDYSNRLDRHELLASKISPILSSDGKPLRPFTLLDSRQGLRKGVFRPGHNLPTMTIDEYLEEERARGGIIEGGGPASELKPEPDEDNYDAADQETIQAREWDEFKESNPRGSGNTLNRG
ncbi:Uncharacterized protein C63.05 [Golovinomyces cichoracearum]|uniref:Uncharacterized protein C63.05 n=1 Tax=Golovinomyces cichoracearum TaxID=62708 RepID=A0A420IBG9_9PEZI|nr:Uncharacterized protein C63.05 [Golovinomyces cichoracearum]